jgi:superfamily I DNA/RNA helicase
MIRYTPEQADVIDWIMDNDGILLVEAGAGTGKSFISRCVVSMLRPKSGIYTAFNKAIVEEGRDRFNGTSIECKTFHALAYHYVKPKLPIQVFNYKTITEKIVYSEKRKVIAAIDEFFVSSSTCMDDYFETRFKIHPRCEHMVQICTSYVQGMVDNEINPTFNFMLKYLHLMLLEKTININVDLVILDEINDVTAVSLEIFKLINAPKKLGLGETNQAIYGFLNLVNGFEELADVATTMKFTKSYRCSEEIANKITKTMRKVLDEDFVFEGTEDPVENGLTLYCTSTNAGIVDKIYDRIYANQGFTLLRNISEIFAAPLAVLSAHQGKKPYQKKYEYLLDIYEDYKKQKIVTGFYKFLQSELDDEEINNAVKLLMKLNSQSVNLYDLYKKAKEAKADKRYTISTVFTSKGLEFETVHLADDINAQFIKACRGDMEEAETLTAIRCYYVACSRCGVNLINDVLY